MLNLGKILSAHEDFVVFALPFREFKGVSDFFGAGCFVYG